MNRVMKYTEKWKTGEDSSQILGRQKRIFSPARSGGQSRCETTLLASSSPLQSPQVRASNGTA